MSELIAVPRHGPYRAVLVLACGHGLPAEGDWSDVTRLSPFLFDCSEGCGQQRQVDLIVRRGTGIRLLMTHELVAGGTELVAHTAAVRRQSVYRCAASKRGDQQGVATAENQHVKLPIPGNRDQVTHGARAR